MGKEESNMGEQCSGASTMLVLPKTCVEVKRIPRHIDRVEKVYIDYLSDGSPTLVMQGVDSTRQVHMLRGDDDLVLGSASHTYEVTGFLDGLVLGTRTVSAPRERTGGSADSASSAERSGYFWGPNKVSPVYYETSCGRMCAELRRTVPRRAQVLYDRADREGYVLKEGQLVVVVKRPSHGQQIIYSAVLERKGSLLAEQTPFLYVTPPFKDKDGWWRFWGTTGTHVCLMDLEERQ